VPVRTKIIEGTVTAGASRSKIGTTVHVPTGETWRIIEVRLYSSVTGKVKLYLLIDNQQEAEFDAREFMTTKLPYPFATEVGAGHTITLEGLNQETTDADVVVTLVYELA